MRRPALVRAAATAAAVLITVGVVAGFAVGRDDENAAPHRTDDALQPVRDATSRYRNVERAIDAGYVQFFGCVHEPLAGAMGMHFVNGDLAGDTVLDPRKPEALMYEERSDGKLSLVGVEYVVFKEAWDTEHSAPPRLFGRTFTTVAEPNRYGIPAFYELHAWVWKANRTGAHQDWNPAVICAHTEGHTP